MPVFLKAYLSLLGARFRTLLQYRTAAWAGFGTQAFWGLIRVMIFMAFFQSSENPQPMDLSQVISYIWLGQALFAMLPWTLDRDVAAQIRTGNVAYELVRPVDLYGFWFSRALAMRVAPMLLRSVPLVALSAGLIPLVGGNAWALHAPASALAGTLFAVSLAAALLLACCFTVLLSITLMWTISAEGVANLMPVAIMVLSGIIIPLPFYPDWFQPVLKVLPFRGLLDVPLRIYNGSIPVRGFLEELGIQGAWIVALVAAGRFALSRGIKRIVVQGG
jgi:ABC-2 type transport system permease protein